MATRTQEQKAASARKAAATRAANKAKKEAEAKAAAEAQAKASAVEAVENARMAGTLAKYRGRYEPSLCAGGRKSLHNGDDLAKLLAGMTPESVCRLADVALKLGDGFCEARYAKLNRGQRRMNAGNRLRAAIKREAITLADVEAALTKVA